MSRLRDLARSERAPLVTGAGIFVALVITEYILEVHIGKGKLSGEGLRASLAAAILVAVVHTLITLPSRITATLVPEVKSVCSDIVARFSVVGADYLRACEALPHQRSFVEKLARLSNGTVFVVETDYKRFCSWLREAVRDAVRWATREEPATWHAVHQGRLSDFCSSCDSVRGANHDIPILNPGYLEEINAGIRKHLLDAVRVIILVDDEAEKELENEVIVESFRKATGLVRSYAIRKDRLQSISEEMEALFSKGDALGREIGDCAIYDGCLFLQRSRRPGEKLGMAVFDTKVNGAFRTKFAARVATIFELLRKEGHRFRPIDSGSKERERRRSALTGGVEQGSAP